MAKLLLMHFAQHFSWALILGGYGSAQLQGASTFSLILSSFWTTRRTMGTVLDRLTVEYN